MAETATASADIQPFAKTELDKNRFILKQLVTKDFKRKGNHKPAMLGSNEPSRTSFHPGYSMFKPFPPACRNRAESGRLVDLKIDPKTAHSRSVARGRNRYRIR